MKKLLLAFLLIFTVTIASTFSASTQRILVPMDETQAEHLRAYGLVYNTLAEHQAPRADWLLNYRGGSFLLPATPEVERWARLRGVTFETISEQQAGKIFSKIEDHNMRRVPLEKAPSIAVYTPPDADPWDDAVTLALDYADIPYDTVYDREVVAGKLFDYDWVHLHHEDFSGQFGKFYAGYRNAPWYLQWVEQERARASSLGFSGVQEMKKTVASQIADYVREGGFLFAMCSSPETLDIALATMQLDCVAPEISGTGVDSECYGELDYENSFAFTDFELVIDPEIYMFSDIDISVDPRQNNPRSESFELFSFSARYDPIPSMLTQNHQQVIKGFLGQSSSFNPELIKDYVIEMAHHSDGRARYIYGPYGDGLFSFYSGHDPEDFAHYVGDPHTNLRSHPNSPGYRLILNNILFPAAEKPDLKT